MASRNQYFRFKFSNNLNFDASCFPSQILKPINTTLTDLIFESRNKEYGAHLIRKIYPKNLLKGLLFANLGVTFLLLLYYILQLAVPKQVFNQRIDYKSEEFSTVDVFLPKIVIETNQSATKEVVVEEKITNTNAEEPISNTSAPPESTHLNTEQNATDQSAQEMVEQHAETVKSTTLDTVGTTLYSQEIFMNVDTKATFAGGDQALEQFLKLNFVTPEYAIANKISALIYVHLIVNTDGSLEDVKLYKGIDQSCNEEAVRVIKLSPKWIPAIKDGRYVRQRIILPVKINTVN